MEKLLQEKIVHAIGCLVCLAVLWGRLDYFGASEFSGGLLTGTISNIAELGSLFFAVALVLSFFLLRAAVTTALLGALLCFPFYLYILAPGLFRWVFKGEYSVPLSSPFHWDTWALIGVVSLVFVATWGVRIFSKQKPGA